MSDFIAQIKAILDTSKIEAQLKKLTKNQKLKLEIDDSNLDEAIKRTEKLKNKSKHKNRWSQKRKKPI